MQADALMLIALIGAHFYFDYAGQGDFMAKAKNEITPIPGIPWQPVMWAHCGIHGAAVALITGVWWIGVLEYHAHLWTDRAKCRGLIDFNQDQVIHIVCKCVWFALAWYLA
jgi:hypothetical protein